MCNLWQTPLPAQAAEPRSTDQWLKWFAEQWDEKAWGGSGRRAYMRSQDDRTWRSRMIAMQGIAAAGKQAVDPLVQALKSDHAPTRLLAAQTLGYLPPPRPSRPFDLSKILAPRRSAERNSDAKRHIGYALERKQQPADRGIIDSLIDWDNGQIDSAKIDKLAPDFRLATISGKNHRLSDYRGKKAVVLVFIYGDT